MKFKIIEERRRQGDTGRQAVDAMAVTLQTDANHRGHLRVETDDMDFAVRLGRATKKPTLSSSAKAAFAASLSGRPAAGPRSGNAWVVRWRVGEMVQQPSWVHTDSDVQAEFGRFLNHLEAPIRPTSDIALHTAMEAVSILWQLRSGALDLAPDDRRTGDTLAAALGELATVEEPPRSVVREAARWFAHKADLFAEEFAKSAGKHGGTAAAVGAGVGAAWLTGKAGDLVGAIRELWEQAR